MKKWLFAFMLIIGIVFLISNTSKISAEEVLEKENCNVDSYYLSDYFSGKELYSLNKDSKHEIASMVKIMTLNLIFENVYSGKLSLDQKIMVSNEAASMGGSQMFLDSNTEYLVSDLVKGIAVCSANDASVALAEQIGGSHEGFVDMMNQKALDLGMLNTKFVNATGLPSEKEQYSTAKDVNIMTRNLMQYDKYYDYANVWNENYVHPSGRTTQISNTNKLLRRYSNCICGKTGYTDKAGFCLSAGALKNNLKVVATVVGGESSDARFNQVVRLFNFAFGKYSNKQYYSKGEILAEVSVSKGKTNKVGLISSSDVYGLCSGSEELANVSIKMNSNLKAPIKKGDVVGKIIVSLEDSTKTYDIVASADIEKKSLFDNLRQILTK